MTKNIFWVIGEQQAGKSMFTTMLKSYGASVLQIGEELRRTITARDFAEQDNPYAPQFVEARVQEMIKSAIHLFKRDPKSVLIIDSAPRNFEQSRLVSDVQEMSTIIFIYENYEIRRNRARQRYGNDLSLFEKREAFERPWLEEFHSVCDEFGIKYIEFRGGDR